MRSYTSKTTTASETIIDINTGNQIHIYTLKLQLIGASANTITIQEGSATVDKYLLNTTGQVEGIATDKRPAYILSNNLKIACTGTDEVGIFVDYEIV